MMKRVVRVVAALLLTLGFVWSASAQAPAEPGASLSSPAAPAEKSAPNSAPSMVVVFLSTILILFIVCKPARKV
jgi:hypothetical protein